MNTATLKIERSGYFVVNPDAQPHAVCGVPTNHVLHYKVEIETTPKQLDSRGFIIDNNDIHNYFIERYKRTPVFRSCEVIAMDACNYFASVVKGCTRCKVSISGNPGAAWLTCEMQDDETTARPQVHTSNPYSLERRRSRPIRVPA